MAFSRLTWYVSDLPAGSINERKEDMMSLKKEGKEKNMAKDESAG